MWIRVRGWGCVGTSDGVVVMLRPSVGVAMEAEACRSIASQHSTASLCSLISAVACAAAAATHTHVNGGVQPRGVAEGVAADDLNAPLAAHGFTVATDLSGLTADDIISLDLRAIWARV